MRVIRVPSAPLPVGSNRIQPDSTELAMGRKPCAGARPDSKATIARHPLPTTRVPVPEHVESVAAGTVPARPASGKPRARRAAAATRVAPG
jgi:hypothetical protein